MAMITYYINIVIIIDIVLYFNDYVMLHMCLINNIYPMGACRLASTSECIHI